jgi:hypothetical protein
MEYLLRYVYITYRRIMQPQEKNVGIINTQVHLNAGRAIWSVFNIQQREISSCGNDHPPQHYDTLKSLKCNATRFAEFCKKLRSKVITNCTFNAMNLFSVYLKAKLSIVSSALNQLYNLLLTYFIKFLYHWSCFAFSFFIYHI